MYHSKVQKGVEDCAYRMPAMKGNSFTFLQDISRHSKNINGRQRIVDRRIWRKKIYIYIYEIYGGKLRQPILNLRATINTAFLLYESCIQNEF